MRASTPSGRSVLGRGLDRIRFVFERLMLRGLRYRLLFAALIVLAVSLLAGTLAGLLDSSFADASDAIWWAFLRLTDPGYLGDDEGVARRLISTIVTVLGYVLFLGLLVAILTQWMNQTLERFESGLTPVALSGHVVILGFTHRTPAIVQDLMRAGGRVDRFLAHRGIRELRIVILAEHVDGKVVQELRERLGPLWDDRRVLFRSGTPLRIDHLERVALREAAVIILPGPDFAEPDPDAVDARTVKTLMTISLRLGDLDVTPPLAVAELCDARRADVARQAYAGDIEIVAADDIISRVIAQSVRQRGLCSVFTELLTVGRGNTLYLYAIGDLAGVPFGELRQRFSRAILLGAVGAGTQRVALNPDPHTAFESDDLLVFVARHFDDCVADRPAPGEAVAAARVPPSELPRGRRLLIMGWSRRVPALLRELARYGSDAFRIDIVSTIPVEARQKLLAGSSSESVRHIEADATVPGVLEAMNPAAYDNVVRVASLRTAAEEEADATSAFAILMLRGATPADGPQPHVLVEMLEEENRFLFEREREDVITSPALVSYLVSQVALRRELAAVFAELSKPWGAQIVLHPAGDYLPPGAAPGRPLRFTDVAAAAAARGEVALGLQIGEGDPSLNPGRDSEWTLAATDSVVVLASYEDAGA